MELQKTCTLFLFCFGFFYGHAHSHCNHGWGCLHHWVLLMDIPFNVQICSVPKRSPPHQFSSVHVLSCVWLFVTPWTAAHQASLSITNSWSLLKLLSKESVMPFNHLILCHPLFLRPLIFPSTGVFSNELAFGIRWPKYWSFSISPHKVKKSGANQANLSVLSWVKFGS